MEQHEEVPLVVRPPLEKQPEIIDWQAPGATIPAPTPEEVRAANAAFTRQEKESAAAAAIMSLWTAGAVVPDLIRDMVEAEEEDEEEARKRKPALPSE